MRRQLSVQPAHIGIVQCVALSHDQQYFISGSADTSIIVWNSLDGSAVFPPLQGHKAEIVALDISRDDKILISASKDGEIHFWDLATGQIDGTPLKHSEEIASVKLSPDGLTLASITKTNELILWGVADRAILLGPFAYPGRDCKAIAFSDDGARIATLCGSISGQPMDYLVGLGIILRETGGGNIVLECNIDDEVEGATVYWPKLEFAVEDKYLVIRYALGEAITSRTFDATTGEEYNQGLGSPELTKINRLAAIDSRIIRNGQTILHFPPDLDHMGTITTWESTDNMIIAGTMSGDVYLVSCKKNQGATLAQG
ncbi:WD40 repeat protein [Mycena venus]|uniref:WD40 repeat protein n=1 Tax=Mycena venus TaxID=2733690 RepID=A0A8H6X273_9AGAR|nr:WD40 repeat protein [Mycena venus]